jgi:hypothetical protein
MWIHEYMDTWPFMHVDTQPYSHGDMACAVGLTWDTICILFRAGSALWLIVQSQILCCGPQRRSRLIAAVQSPKADLCFGLQCGMTLKASIFLSEVKISSDCPVDEQVARQQLGQH